MQIPIYQVDAFTAEPFSGNPAAVCLLTGAREEQWMQKVAREMNLSETAFLYKMADGYNLRWFTPTVEVDLCGHATLAAAYVLFETGRLAKREEARFHTKSGVLKAVKREDWIELDFPAEPVVEAEIPSLICDALNVTPLFCGKNRLDYLVEVGSEKILREITPDNTLLRKLNSRGVIVTSRTDKEGLDFVSRFFAPGVGIDEDPVTGSAHCCLGPYWQMKTGKNEFLAYQASERGGYIKVRVGDDRVYLGGQAAMIIRGEFTLLAGR